MDKTRPIEITEAAYAELNENRGGFCIEWAYGVEPDATAGHLGHQPEPLPASGGDHQGRSSTIQPRRGSSWA